MTNAENFEEFFRKATGEAAFPFQQRFAEAPGLPQLIRVRTGLGKTAMAVVGWLWRRFGADESFRDQTPRRLVYCLPMRVLVEQTRDNAVLWLQNVGLLAGTAEFDEGDGTKRLRSYTPDCGDPGKVAVHVLMGGEEQDDWDIHPEREAILVGTQDMLLSRVLNRGYAAGRSRWPMQFGLLNTDCLWVFDEIQLMGAGLASTAQLEAFRRLLGGRDGHGCRSVWMSATMQKNWLKTVDFESFLEDAQELGFDFKKEIEANALGEKARKTLEDRWKAKKPLVKARPAMDDAAEIATEVRRAHKAGTRTIVVVNTVKRACELYKALETDGGGDTNPKLILLHSRFRPKDRKKQVDDALAEIKPGEPGTIVVSTQVIEAGVDVSATTLFTELAPWASLVQRFGRCNRRGEDNEAQVFWIDSPDRKADVEKMAPPYEPGELAACRKELEKLRDVGLKSLPKVELAFEHAHLIRRKDLIDLFDTTPDLAGNDIDIDRFVREVEDSDVRVFWRDYGKTPNETNGEEAEAAPRREELCPAPIGQFRDFAKKHSGKVWRWNFLDKEWEPVGKGKISPGQAYMVHVAAGGYSAEQGWTGNPTDKEKLDAPSKRDEGQTPDSNEDDAASRIGVWQTIAEHAEEVCAELDGILKALSMKEGEAEALRHAARWHDRGKAHGVFQDAIHDGQVEKRKGKEIKRRERPESWRGCRFVAKAPKKRKNGEGEVIDPGFWRNRPPYRRRHFRHELGSAIAVLLAPAAGGKGIPGGLLPMGPNGQGGPLRDLVAYLVAAHHGKVRLSIRSLPNESRPAGGRRFARGVWDCDELPKTDLGGDIPAPAVTLSLEPMELGLCEHEQFAGQPSWTERMIRLRDALGPFRLAYLEAILRAADIRASKEAEHRAVDTRSRA